LSCSGRSYGRVSRRRIADAGKSFLCKAFGSLGASRPFQ
jgi:hypothetical protein